MRAESLLVALLIVAGCGGRDAAVLFNAPPDLDGATVYVDSQIVGHLKATHSYRAGRFASAKEMAAPPRFEANLAVAQLPSGTHDLRIVKAGYAEFHSTFVNRSSHVEVFVPDEAAKKTGG